MTQYTIENPVFRVYVIAAALMVLKMALQSWMTVYRMTKVKGGFRSPEDIKKSPLNRDPSPEQLQPNEYVERSRRLHLNDCENIPPFLVVGLLFVAVAPPLWRGLEPIYQKGRTDAELGVRRLWQGWNSHSRVVVNDMHSPVAREINIDGSATTALMHLSRLATPETAAGSRAARAPSPNQRNEAAIASRPPGGLLTNGSPRSRGGSQRSASRESRTTSAYIASSPRRLSAPRSRPSSQAANRATAMGPTAKRPTARRADIGES